MLTFFLLVNRQGQTRMSKYYNHVAVEERVVVEGEIIRKCLARRETQCSFMEYKNTKVIYRRYASLYFIVGADATENELGVLEFIHLAVETLDSFFENVVCLECLFPFQFPIFFLFIFHFSFLRNLNCPIVHLPLESLTV